jgi:DNA-binding transcriptional LysR family regulator
VVVRRLPMVWIGLKGYAVARGAPIPLALFESPCVFRQPAVEALERTQRPWRLAFTSPSLSGLWAATAAGLGVTVRTPLGLPSPLTVLGASSGLPKLPQTALSLYMAQPEPPQAVARLREILIEELPLSR